MVHLNKVGYTYFSIMWLMQAFALELQWKFCELCVCLWHCIPSAQATQLVGRGELIPSTGSVWECDRRWRKNSDFKDILAWVMDFNVQIKEKLFYYTITVTLTVIVCRFYTTCMLLFKSLFSPSNSQHTFGQKDSCLIRRI